MSRQNSRSRCRPCCSCSRRRSAGCKAGLRLRARMRRPTPRARTRGRPAGMVSRGWLASSPAPSGPDRAGDLVCAGSRLGRRDCAARNHRERVELRAGRWTGEAADRGAGAVLALAIIGATAVMMLAFGAGRRLVVRQRVMGAATRLRSRQRTARAVLSRSCRARWRHEWRVQRGDTEACAVDGLMAGVTVGASFSVSVLGPFDRRSAGVTRPT